MDAKQDLVISIDLGMTLTKVGYTYFPHSDPCILHCDGCRSDGVIPTVLVYNQYAELSESRVIAWGNEAAERIEQNRGEKENFKNVEWFKLYLDDDLLLRACQSGDDYRPRSRAEIQKWYLDYLKILHQRIQNSPPIQRSGIWADLSVRFEFSYPTTWSTSVVEKFRDCILRAGFGDGGSKHVVGLTCNEAQAAALFLTKEITNVSQGQNILVCDAGGGTVDVALVQVVISNGVNRFRVKRKHRGKLVGSTAIDLALQKLVSHRLSKVLSQSETFLVAEAIRQDPSWTDIRLKATTKENQVFEIPIPQPYVLANNPDANVLDGGMFFSTEDIRSLFDEPLEVLKSAIFEAVEEGRMQVHYLALCGGWAYDKMVREALEGLLDHARPKEDSGLAGAKLFISPEPSKAVVMGNLCRDLLLPIWVQYRMGLVCGECSFNIAELSQCRWTDQIKYTHIGRHVSWMETPSTTSNAASGTFLWSFKHSKVSTLYLTLVVIPIGQSDGTSPTDICQLRYTPPHDKSLKHYFRRGPHQASIRFDWSNAGSSGGELMLQLMCEDRTIPCERLNVRSDIPSVIKVNKCSDLEEADWRATRVLKR